jgi:glucose/arabinose dehydrogenase
LDQPTQAEPTQADITTQAAVTVFPDPARAGWQLVAQGFARPVFLSHASDERLFIVEQPGRIQVIVEGVVQETPFLDISDRVRDSGNEQGLLGLAFDPSFDQNGRFYVNYTGSGGTTFISRFEISNDPNQADPDSENILLSIEQPYANHNGGVIAFGPDDYLYIGLGDGGSAGDPQGNAQNLDSLLGKILRLDVSGAEGYTIPPDNPFAAGGGRAEVWAYGLRNPWRFAFDTATGDLFIGDVGQNAWEEVNYQPAGEPGGQNYGWDLLEGTHPYEADSFPSGILPIAEYSHDQGCSVTGGVVVRDPNLTAWNGVYLFGDYCTGNIWGILPDGAGGWNTQLLFDTDFNISSFGLDAIGRVYLTDLNGGIYRLEPVQ